MNLLSIFKHGHSGMSEKEIYGAYKIFFGTLVSSSRLKIINLLRKGRKNVSEIILATSNTLQDNPIVAEAEKLNIKVFRGSKSDLVSRLYEAVKISPCETILKINGNYPLFDPYLANDLISEHIREAFDFSYNEHINGTLYGTGCEVVKKILLLDLNNEKLTPEQRESGTLYFHQNEYKFKVNKFVASRVTLIFIILLELDAIEPTAPSIIITELELAPLLLYNAILSFVSPILTK